MLKARKEKGVQWELHDKGHLSTRQEESKILLAKWQIKGTRPMDPLTHTTPRNSRARRKTELVADL